MPAERHSPWAPCYFYFTKSIYTTFKWFFFHKTSVNWNSAPTAALNLKFLQTAYTLKWNILNRHTLVNGNGFFCVWELGACQNSAGMTHLGRPHANAVDPCALLTEIGLRVGKCWVFSRTWWLSGTRSLSVNTHEYPQTWEHRTAWPHAVVVAKPGHTTPHSRFY